MFVFYGTFLTIFKYFWLSFVSKRLGLFRIQELQQPIHINIMSFCLLSDDVSNKKMIRIVFIVSQSIQIDYILIVSDWIFVIVSQNDSHQAGTGHSLASGWSQPRSADVSRCENLNFISHLYHGLPEIRSQQAISSSHTATFW